GMVRTPATWRSEPSGGTRHQSATSRIPQTATRWRRRAATARCGCGAPPPSRRPMPRPAHAPPRAPAEPGAPPGPAPPPPLAGRRLRPWVGQQVRSQQVDPPYGGSLGTRTPFFIAFRARLEPDLVAGLTDGRLLGVIGSGYSMFVDVVCEFS